MSTPTYDHVVEAALSGTRAVVDHLPLDSIGSQFERVQGLEWDDLPFGDLALDEAIGDVIADVNTAVRRYPVAIAVIIVATAVATCGAVWTVRRRRSRRAAAEATELRLAGVA